MKRDIIISISDDPNKRAAKPKPPVRPSKKHEFLARRTNEPQIRFYDLAQVNHGDLDNPTWEDHPILKTPAYTTEAVVGGSKFFGVRYLVDPFTNADYQNYTDMMFDYPVADWRQRYRRILGITDYGNPETDDYKFDMRFSLRDSTISNLQERFIPDRLASKSFLGQTNFDIAKEDYLTNYHHYWNNDRSFAGHRTLDKIEGQFTPRNGSGDSVAGGYFGYSNGRKTVYKVTATLDAGAADIPQFSASGNYDVFLMPQIGFYMATGHSSDWKTTQTLGLCYQVMPRYLWPLFIEPPDTVNGDGLPGSDAAVSDWIDYQKGRSGMQASTWTFTGVPDSSDLDYTEAPITVLDWTGLTKWGSAVTGGASTTIFGSYYSMDARGNEQTDAHTHYNTEWQTNTGIGLFQGTDPFLVAVIQQATSFYYVWDVSYLLDPGSSNVSVVQTSDQQDRFRLSRSISWDPGYGGTVGNILPRDGTGPLFDG